MFQISFISQIFLLYFQIIYLYFQIYLFIFFFIFHFGFITFFAKHSFFCIFVFSIFTKLITTVFSGSNGARQCTKPRIFIFLTQDCMPGPVAPHTTQYLLKNYNQRSIACPKKVVSTSILMPLLVTTVSYPWSQILPVRSTACTPK